MCGGEGSRLESPHEKPRHPVEGVPMVDRVIAAIDGSRIETTYAAVSPNAPATRARLEGADGVQTIETAGDGYVADLLAVLDRPAIEPPILTVVADLPLLEASVIDRVLERYGGNDGRFDEREEQCDDGNEGDTGAQSLTVCVPVALKRRLEVSCDSRLEPESHLAPTGVNVVGSTDHSMTDVSYDPRLAVNVNRREDAAVAIDHLSRRRDRRSESDRQSRDGRRSGRDDPCA